MTRRLLLAAALAVLVALSAGCQAAFDVNVDIDRNGRGTVTCGWPWTATPSRPSASPPTRTRRWRPRKFAPMLADGGWCGGDTQIAATRDDDSGELVLETSHAIDSIDQLEDVLSLPAADLAGIAPDAVDPGGARRPAGRRRRS